MPEAGAPRKFGGLFIGTWGALDVRRGGGPWSWRAPPSVRRAVPCVAACLSGGCAARWMVPFNGALSLVRVEISCMDRALM